MSMKNEFQVKVKCPAFKSEAMHIHPSEFFS